MGDAVADEKLAAAEDNNDKKDNINNESYSATGKKRIEIPYDRKGDLVNDGEVQTIKYSPKGPGKLKVTVSNLGWFGERDILVAASINDDENMSLFGLGTTSAGDLSE